MSSSILFIGLPAKQCAAERKDKTPPHGVEGGDRVDSDHSASTDCVGLTDVISKRTCKTGEGYSWPGQYRAFAPLFSLARDCHSSGAQVRIGVNENLVIGL